MAAVLDYCLALATNMISLSPACIYCRNDGHPILSLDLNQSCVSSTHFCTSSEATVGRSRSVGIHTAQTCDAVYVLCKLTSAAKSMCRSSSYAQRENATELLLCQPHADSSTIATPRDREGKTYAEEG